MERNNQVLGGVAESESDGRGYNCGLYISPIPGSEIILPGGRSVWVGYACGEVFLRFYRGDLPREVVVRLSGEAADALYSLVKREAAGDAFYGYYTGYPVISFKCRGRNPLK